MTRYVRRPPRAECESDWVWLGEGVASPQTVTVFEPEDKLTFSGIYDSDGTPLYRDDCRPIGFIHP